MNGPKKYQSYMNTDTHWLGDIPTHWNIQRMKFTALIVAGQSPPSETVSEFAGAFPFLQGNAEFGGKTPTPKLSCQFPNKKAKKQDILLSVRAPVGALNIADQAYGIGRGLCAIRPHQNVNRDFLYYTLLTTKESLDEVATGSTYDAVAIGDVGNVLTPLPPHDEQTAIVRFLDHADDQIQRYIAGKERLIALLEEERQALVHQAVTRGLDPSVKLKPSGVEWLGDVPEHWEIAKLKFLCNRIQNGATPPTDEPRYYDNGTIPWYGPSSWTLQDEPTSPVRYLNTDAFDQGKARLIRNPALLVVVIGATSGRMGLLTRDGSTNQQITAFELDTTLVEPMFLLRQVGQCEHWLRATASTATIPILNSNVVSGLPVAVPPLSEQGAILERLTKGTDRLDAAISSAQSQVHLMNEYRTRLIADVVTGQLDVREAAEELPTPEPTEITD